METDVIKLIESKYDVNILSGIDIFTVKLPGPKDTSYEGGTWKIRVFLPEKYPFQAPKIGFVNKVFHPNIDEASGVICLDVIDESWSALYDLREVFRDIQCGGLETGSNSVCLSVVHKRCFCSFVWFGFPGRFQFDGALICRIDCPWARGPGSDECALSGPRRRYVPK